MQKTTCWTLIRSAAEGDADSKRDFAERYQPVVRAYLRARWRDRLDAEEMEEAMQEVFLECFREGGILERTAEIEGGFHGFLFGATRNVARRIEERRARRLDAPGSVSFSGEDLPTAEEELSKVFDRAWARAVLGEASRLLRERARERGGEAERRAELLRLRFQEGLSIRDIARRWGTSSAALYTVYESACREFEATLKDVVLSQDPWAPEKVSGTCRELIALLG